MSDVMHAGHISARQKLIDHYAAVRRRMTPNVVPKAVVTIKPPPPAYDKEVEKLIFQQAFPESNKRRQIKVAKVVKVVSAHFKIDENDVLSERRTKHLVLARQAVYWLCKECTPMSYPRIGYWLGGRDHTTILHGVRVMQKRIDAGHEIADDCLYLRDLLLGEIASNYWGA